MIHPLDDASEFGTTKLLIQHSAGTREQLSLPPPTTLAKVFRMFYRVDGVPHFQNVHFLSVRLTDDGKVIATVASRFSGGYSGTEMAGFRWTGARWQLFPQTNVLAPAIPGWPVDTEVVATETSTRAAINGIYGLQVLPDLAYLRDPNYLLNQVEFLDGAKFLRLGVGTATAMRGNVVVGYQGGANAFGQRCESRTSAVAWFNSKLKRLGSGVANDVDVAGQIVGDDRRTFGARGRPVVWSTRGSVALSREEGSAYAISDSGTVVGRIGQSAFIANAGCGDFSAQRLDRFLIDRNWHIAAAYGVSAKGDVLAIGRYRAGPQRVVRLRFKSSGDHLAVLRGIKE